MNRRILILAVAAIIGTTVLAPAPALAAPRVAIVAQGDDATTSADLDRLVAKVGQALIESHHVTLVSRSRLGAVLAEQGLSNSDYADPRTAANLGRIVGANEILWVEMTLDASGTDGGFVAKADVDASAEFELITVSTAVITRTGTADGTDDQDSVTQFSDGTLTRLRHTAIDACADDLVGQLHL
jgi:hypothetical protein